MNASKTRRSPLRYLCAGCAVASFVGSCTGVVSHRAAGLLLLTGVAAFVVDLMLDPFRR